jgi:polysaccharide deacetylase 2 family uncharacterized protein YibQ
MDDLDRPLGQKTSPAAAPRLPVLFLRLGIGAVGAVALAAIAWITLIDDPFGGQPVAVAPIRDAPPVADSPPPPAPAGPAVLTEIGPAAPAGAGAGEPGAPDVITILDPSRPGPVTLSEGPDPALLEDGPYGPLPRIGDGGTRPMDAYARPAPPPGPEPRIAIVLGGLGLDQAATDAAINNLPGEITLAFAPYGEKLDEAVAAARRAGHEVALQLPMEPFGYPATDPGPHTLRTGDAAGGNADDLAWLLSRFGAYCGVVNYMGAALTADAAALAPVLAAIGERGLYFLDDGSSGRSQAAQVAPGLAPFAGADLVLDASSDPAAIDRSLARLEDIARRRGHAVATATGFPVTTARLAAWARGLAARGFTLVPMTALVEDGRAATGQSQMSSP